MLKKASDAIARVKPGGIQEGLLEHDRALFTIRTIQEKNSDSQPSHFFALAGAAS
jgi:hypothetical protein